MIGGTDIVIPSAGNPSALGACARVVQLHWRQARFEDAVTGEKYSSYAEIPLGQVHELLAYANAQAEAAWDADSPDSPPNSMLHLILSDDCVTVVLDDPTDPDMRSMLESIRAVLRPVAAQMTDAKSGK